MVIKNYGVMTVSINVTAKESTHRPSVLTDVLRTVPQSLTTR
jgi:hypothetical protein